MYTFLLHFGRIKQYSIHFLFYEAKITVQFSLSASTLSSAQFPYRQSPSLLRTVDVRTLREAYVTGPFDKRRQPRALILLRKFHIELSMCLSIDSTVHSSAISLALIGVIESASVSD